MVAFVNFIIAVNNETVGQVSSVTTQETARYLRRHYDKNLPGKKK